MLDDFQCGQCSKNLDLVFAVDISSSIDETELAQMRSALVKIMQGFVYGPDATNIGIVQYHRVASTVLPLTQGTSLATVTAAVAQIGQVPGRSGTAISSGVRNGTAQLLTGRSAAYKVLITVTDGQANTLVSGANCDSVNTNVPPNGCVADIRAAVADCHTSIPGDLEALFSLGIGDAISDTELVILADGKREQYTYVDAFVNFQNFVAKIINDVCAALPGPPCTNAPTAAPTPNPTRAPTDFPTAAPTERPTQAPTTNPTRAPTPPTSAPTTAPTVAPTLAPTEAPTPPTTAPTLAPTEAPTEAPTPPTEAPTPPTDSPTGAPTPPTEAPTGAPTFACLCDDNDFCTIDTCDQRTGLCSNTPVVCTQTPDLDGRNCSLISCNALNGTCTNITDVCGAQSVNAGAVAGGVIGGLAALAAAGALVAAGVSQSGAGSSAAQGLFNSDSGIVDSGIYQGSNNAADNPLMGDQYFTL